MIRQCDNSEVELIYSIISDAAEAYKGVIPGDRWEEPYMSKDELQHEIDQGVVFWGYEQDGQLVGVMGIQHLQDVTLIRHAYVRAAKRNQGMGGEITILSSSAGDSPAVSRHLGRCPVGNSFL